MTKSFGYFSKVVFVQSFFYNLTGLFDIVFESVEDVYIIDSFSFSNCFL